jgi:HAD superfamily hydrolase (TIGR01493 family)
MGGVNLAEIDAVTIDGFGTMLDLDDPVPKLSALLPAYEPAEIERAFRVEVDYYSAHSHAARDEETLAELRAGCTDAFNQALGSSLTSEEYNGAFTFHVLPGVPEALQALRARGLALAVVANWDFGLHDHLACHNLTRWFDVVVVSGEVGVRKPDPAPFRLALDRLGVRPERAVHVGDHPPHDEEGARAAGMRFEPAPLAEAVARWR